VPDRPLILVTGFEPFAGHAVNPSGELAKALDGHRVGAAVVRAAILPVHHAEVGPRVAELLAETEPAAAVHLGLAEGRARLALERVALNVMDYRIPDNAGCRVEDAPCVAGGPAAYLSTLPLRAMRDALIAEGIPAYISSTAGTFLCNQTLYTSLHAIARVGARTRAGFVHLPLLPSMVASSDLDQPSMDLAVMRRGLEVVLRVVAEEAP
jgi:pyroglutamyl-peptidase